VTRALHLEQVGLVRDDAPILVDIDWTVAGGERWIVLGANGSGKTSLVRVCALWLHPSTGLVEVLGERLGRTDVRRLRERIGLASAGLADQLRPRITGRDAVMTARHGALEPWWHDYDAADRERADLLLEQLGVGFACDRAFGSLSSGERQRVLLARTLMNDPGLVLLDEPAAGLDLPGREQLLGALGDLAADPAGAPTVLVTHHVEEIPPRFTHVLLLREGRVHASGPLDETLTAESLSSCFGMPLVLARDPGSGRFTARSAGR
jgi:iron complex transport system ATP-binding protein